MVESSVSRQRFVGRSGSRMVEVEADGLARVVDIRIDSHALRRMRGTELGAHILEAVRRVRAEIRAKYRTNDGNRHV